MENNRYRLKPHEVAALQKLRESETRNILVIGDLHEPFCLDGYLDWCLEQYETFNCNQVIFIGDILDNHALKRLSKKFLNGTRLFLMLIFVLAIMIGWLLENHSQVESQRLG